MPRDFRFGVSVPDRHHDDMSLAVVDDGFWRRADAPGAGRQGLEFVDFAEINFLSAASRSAKRGPACLTVQQTSQSAQQERPPEAIAMKCPTEVYAASTRPYDGLPDLAYPLHDRDILVTACGRICLHRKKSTSRPPLQAIPSELAGLRAAARRRGPCPCT